MGEHFSRIYGLKYNSILNELKYFNVIGGMTPDVMHDILEGTLPKLTSLFLNHCISEKRFFKLKKLNKILKNFNYGNAEVKDRPSPILMQHLKAKKIHGLASQKWLLGVNLPMMIASLIDVHDPLFKNFCLFLNICAIVFSSTINNSDLLTLDELVCDFLSGFKSCYPNENITFKIHNLTHYSKYIEELGPLISFWCMRMESKHSYFKALQKRIGNWLNVSWTLAYRHEQFMCEKFLIFEGKFLSLPVVTSKK